MESRFCTYKRVGYLRERVAYELGIEFTGVIYASPGVLKHIIKRHGRQFDKRTRTGILEWMKKILDDPDYIGIYKNDEGEVRLIPARRGNHVLAAKTAKKIYQGVTASSN